MVNVSSKTIKQAAQRAGGCIVCRSGVSRNIFNADKTVYPSPNRLPLRFGEPHQLNLVCGLLHQRVADLAGERTVAETLDDVWHFSLSGKLKTLDWWPPCASVRKLLHR
jgi:hypothetical protein